jgi:EAL domain-containing protein (putative c-di-GMP-specific phosphodiesterase class I)
MQLELGREEDFQASVSREELSSLLDGDHLTIAWQPIVSLPSHDVIGYEALARFAQLADAEPLSPVVWFSAASHHGLRERLELLAARSAFSELDRLPADGFVSLNVSPATASHPDLEGLVVGVGPDRVVLEIAEDAVAGAAPDVVDALARLRDKGVRVAVDDTGSGLVSLRQLLGVHADIIKIDTDVVRGIDTDVTKQAIAFALKSLAERSGAVSLAEGVETEEEAEMLESLGVEAAQGFLFGRPEPLS